MDKLPEIVEVRTLERGTFVVDVVTDDGLKMHWPILTDEAEDMLGAITVYMNQWNDYKYASFKRSIYDSAKRAAQA